MITQKEKDAIVTNIKFIADQLINNESDTNESLADYFGESIPEIRKSVANIIIEHVRPIAMLSGLMTANDVLERINTIEWQHTVHVTVTETYFFHQTAESHEAAVEQIQTLIDDEDLDLSNGVLTDTEVELA